MTITIKKVAKKTGVSQFAVKENVLDLLEVMPVKDRIPVLEHMVYCKENRRRCAKMKLDLDRLPADPDATDGIKFLGVTSDKMWQACKEYEHRMKQCKDPHEEFGLKRELIVEAAQEVSQRNMEWIREHLDPHKPKDLLAHLHKAPQDKAMWVLKLLRRHGFRQVDLTTWMAADVFLSEWVEKMARDLLQKLVHKL